jgi:hypothetical protein
MTSTYVPATALRRRLVDVLRANSTLCDPDTGLLYGVEGRRDSTDMRVWSVDVQFPPDSDLIFALPRVMVECVGRAHDFEQEDPDVLSGPVRLFIHTVVPRDQEELGERIDAYLIRLLLSTWLSDARIIAARLSLEGDRRKVRVPALDGAWQITSGFSTPNVGSLV